MPKARQGLPTAWCHRYGLKKSASFSFEKYPDGAAGELSTEWSRKMQFFDIFRDAGGGSEIEFIEVLAPVGNGPLGEDGSHRQGLPL